MKDAAAQQATAPIDFGLGDGRRRIHQEGPATIGSCRRR